MIRRVLAVGVALFLLAVPAAATETEDPGAAVEPEIEEPEALPYSVTTLDELADPSDEGAAALKETITALIGTYTPRTQTVTEYLSDGSVIEYQQIVPGLAGLDYPWLAAATFFGLLLFCFFKILGGLIKL